MKHGNIKVRKYEDQSKKYMQNLQKNAKKTNINKKTFAEQQDLLNERA